MVDGVSLLQDFLADSAKARPDHVALVCGDVRLTYGTLHRRARAVARALVAEGVEPGDRVVIFCENGLEAVIAFWAVLEANAVVSVINPRTKKEKLAYCLADSGAKVLIADAGLVPTWGPSVRATAQPPKVMVAGDTRRASLPARMALLDFAEAMASANSLPEVKRRRIDIDLAAIIYTSGSTGDPKGVMLTHRNMITASTSITCYLRNVPEDVILCALPLAFDYGLYQMIMAFQVGARLVLERSFVFPAKVLGRISEEKVTGFPGVPTLFALLGELSHGQWDFSSVRYVTNTAQALPGKQVALLRTIFPEARIYSMYGLTECKRCTFLPPEDLDRKPGSVGLPIPNTELWIIDEQGRKLPPNQVGELVIRGATVMRGYWNKPEATAEKLVEGPLPGERVLRTGDLCRLDEDGYLYFVGRMDDIIKCRGEKVAPKEVEGVLLEAPGVKEACVVGVPDPIVGQAVKAFVVAESSASLAPEALIALCRGRLEPHCVPCAVELVPELPKTATGKIHRAALLERVGRPNEVAKGR